MKLRLLLRLFARPKNPMVLNLGVNGQNHSEEPWLLYSGALLFVQWFLCMNMSAEPFAYVSLSTQGAVVIIDTATNTVVGSPISVPGAPLGIAITSDGLTVYVTNFAGNTVTPIDTATNIAGAPIVVGNQPLSIAITPDDAFAYITNFASDSVSVIDIATNTVVGSPIPVGDQPFGIAITPNGQTAYVANSNDDTVTPINLATNTPGMPIAAGDRPFGIVITPDGTTAYVSAQSADTVVPITIATNTAGTPIPVGDQPSFLTITPDGAFLYVPDGPDGSVVVIDTATNTVVGSPIVTGGLLPLDVAITPDGKTAYVTNAGSGTVTPIDIETNVAGTPIPVGSGPGSQPLGIAIIPAVTPPTPSGPVDVTGVIIRNIFLNRTDRVLIIRWEENPEEEGVIAYRIFNGDEIIGTVAATEPLLFYINLCCNQETNNFSVASVFEGDIESDHVPVVIE